MRTQPYNAFWQRIHQTARAKEFPLRVMFELTYRCNFKCRHCYVPLSYRKKKELKTKEVFSILGQLKDIGCFYLGFTGGEPFIRKDIMDILWHAKEKGFELIIYSNGSLINEEIAQELKHLRPNKVDITIPAMSKNAFEQITGMPGSHQRVFTAIDLLHKRGVKLGFKTCVLKENKTEIKEIQDFAASLDGQHRLDDMLSPRLDGSREPYRFRGRMTEDRRQMTEDRVEDNELPNCQTAKLLNRRKKTDSLFKCGVGTQQAAITPSGELKMCLMIDYPKYKIVTRNTSGVTRSASNLKNAWDKLKEFVASIKPDRDYKCNICKLEPYCKWCPARAWLENKSFTICDPESRHWAEDLIKATKAYKANRAIR